MGSASAGAVSEAKRPPNLVADGSSLRTANILLIGIRALGNEIAKNLVLAGIGSLTIIDDDIVTEDDLGAQFALSQESIGQVVSLLLLCHRAVVLILGSAHKRHCPICKG